MDINSKSLLGSQTAKGGFANEKEICIKFNSWKNDNDAQAWLTEMGYNVEKISSLKAIHVPMRIGKKDMSKYDISEEEYNEFVRYKKADAQLKIMITICNLLKIETLSLKKANKKANFNQVDKRSVDDYQKMWRFDNEIADWLKLYSGESLPLKKSNHYDYNNLRDQR